VTLATNGQINASYSFTMQNQIPVRTRLLRCTINSVSTVLLKVKNPRTEPSPVFQQRGSHSDRSVAQITYEIITLK